MIRLQALSFSRRKGNPADRYHKLLTLPAGRQVTSCGPPPVVCTNPQPAGLCHCIAWTDRASTKTSAPKTHLLSLADCQCSSVHCSPFFTGHCRDIFAIELRTNIQLKRLVGTQINSAQRTAIDAVTTRLVRKCWIVNCSGCLRFYLRSRTFLVCTNFNFPKFLYDSRNILLQEQLAKSFLDSRAVRRLIR